MKRVSFGIVAIAVLILFATTAHSAAGLYAAGNIGGAMLRDTDLNNSDLEEAGIELEFESETGFAFAAAVGYDLGNNFRAEGEIAYQKNEVDQTNASYQGVTVDASEYFDGETSSLTLLANGYYDISIGGPLTPFVSAGLGFSNVSGTLEVQGEEGEDEDDTVFAYQIGGGISYAFSETLSLDVKYRYFATSDPDFEGIEIEYSSHNFYAGLRVSLF